MFSLFQRVLRLGDRPLGTCGRGPHWEQQPAPCRPHPCLLAPLPGLKSLQTNLLCTLPGPNPLTLQTELRPASLLCVSVSLHVSPSLCPCISVSLALSLCLWPRLCISGPVSVSLALSRCLPLPLPACSLLHQQEGTYPFLGKPVLGGAGDSQGTRQGRQGQERWTLPGWGHR